MKARIKVGAKISQDFSFGEWPNCFPPKAEYEGEEYRYEAKNPFMIFDVVESNVNDSVELVTEGYGGKHYGSGSIHVLNKEDIIIVNENHLKDNRNWRNRVPYLDKFTFGDSPAAEYLADTLNEVKDKLLIQKISKFISNQKALLNSLLDSNFSGRMSVKEVSTLVMLIRKDVINSGHDKKIELEKDDSYLAKKSILCYNLAANIIIGDCKTVMRRAAKATLINRKHVKDRSVIDLYRVPDINKIPSLQAKNKKRQTRINQ